MRPPALPKGDGSHVMTSLLDWIGRVVMMVLAGLITLSIIGAISAIPSGPVGTRMGVGEAPPAPPVIAEPETERIERRAAPAAAEPTPGAGTGLPLAAPERKDADSARWLEAITYALLALVGLAALACLLLWRGLGRIARTLESSRSGDAADQSA